MAKKIVKRRVYVLSGKTEEDIAMAMAVTSRSPLPFDEILKGIDKDRSSKFLEKFYISYGHGSIADTAMVHIAMENVSQIAIKALEDTRLAAYQEKSTRYQIIDRNHAVYPSELEGGDLKIYQETINELFDVYEEMVNILLESARRKVKKNKEESEGAYENRIRIPVIDRCRLLLPAATMGNVGFTMSGRSIEYTIAKMLSSNLMEVKELAQEIKSVAIKQLPILVKYADPISYLVAQKKSMKDLAQKMRYKKSSPKVGVKLLHYDRDALERVISASIYRFSDSDYRDIYKSVKKMSMRKKEKLFDQIIGERKQRHDKPFRELEDTTYTFEIVCDYGAFRDLQRHRMTVQTIPELNINLGFIEPDGLAETGIRDKYRVVMAKAKTAYEQISKKNLEAAQYIVPMAYNRRFLFQMNLREALYIIELRSRPQGHISYRRIAWQMWDQINKVHPYFAKHIKVNRSDDQQR